MTSIITRRSLLRGLLAAPAIVAASSLMPIRDVSMEPYRFSWQGYEFDLASYDPNIVALLQCRIKAAEEVMYKVMALHVEDLYKSEIEWTRT